MRLHRIVSLCAIVGIAQAGLATDKSEKVKTWQSTNDYPSRALREGREGTVYFSILVGPDGKGKSCTVITSSGHSDLDQAACATAMRRATFNPAKDADGNPIDGVFRSSMTYKIPR
jgi:periplasmic protein TonB